MAISLISNTGIQFYKTNIQFNWNQFRKSFYFHQFMSSEGKLELEVAQEVDDPITHKILYVSKDDLKTCKMLDHADEFSGPWKSNSKIRVFDKDEVIIEANSSTLRDGLFGNSTPEVSRFFEQWLPFPCFGKKGSQIGPYNWVRMMVVPKNYDPTNVRQYVNGYQDWQVVLAFDTTAEFDDGNYNEEFRETPLFANKFEDVKEFCFPMSDMKVMNFVAPSNGNKVWIDSGIMKLVHGTTDVDVVYNKASAYAKACHNGIGPVPRAKVYGYLANYMYFLHMVATMLANETVELVNGLQTKPINVDLVVDMGNSKTTAVLFEDGHFDKVAMLELQDFSHPVQSERSPFDMTVVFDKANFGICNIKESKQFVYPSLVRLGREATYLRYQAGIDEGKGQNQSACSSPKRYLWDKHPSPFEWQNIRHGNGAPEPINLEGITNQFNGDGTLIEGDITMREKRYSRRSLMTFSFLEILAQANRHINNPQFREKHGQPDQPRRIAKIIVTCPTAMSKQEQIELRTAAAEAYVVLDRYYKRTDKYPLVYVQAIDAVPVIPSLRSLTRTNRDGNRSWVYDEATCVQFVYLCAEIAKRYMNNCEALVETYGKLRNDLLMNPEGEIVLHENINTLSDKEKEKLVPYPKKTLTVGSVDIGAGTTDVMICTYKYEVAGQTTLTPIPRYWESFYTAGDDIMKEFVLKIIIEDEEDEEENKYAMVETKLKALGKSDKEISQLITDFFGPDTNRMSFAARQVRKEFCQQISVPIAQRFMELTSNNVEKRDLSWDDIFNSDNIPNKVLLDRFEKHFGFRIEEQIWHYDMKVTTGLIKKVMEGLLKKISKFLSDYDCDIVLLAGRPCALKPIEDLFVQNYPVDPTSNRMKVLKDNYRVGEWYPFQHGKGYFEDQKSIVAVGALLGYICSEQGGFDNLSIDLDVLSQLMQPTANYIGFIRDNAMSIIPDVDIILTPSEDHGEVFVPSLPVRFGCRQFETSSYPARPLFNLELDEKAMRNSIIAELQSQDLVGKDLNADDEILIQGEIQSQRSRFRNIKLEVDRKYDTDREGVKIVHVKDVNGHSLAKDFLSLQIKSLNESDAFWMDNGVFKTKLAARH